VILGLREPMRRREFITVLGGAAAWPLAARAQQAAVIGVLGSGSPEPFASPITSFRLGLQERGWVEGGNLVIEYRWAEGHYDRLPALAADLLRRGVSAIFANSSAAVVAAKATTTAIPIVFTMGGDAVERRFVASINRPGGNITGVNFFASTLGAKQIELLHELLPAAASIALLVNPRNSGADIQIAHAREAARAMGQRIDVVTASSAEEIDAAFAMLGTQRAQALLVGGDAFLLDRRDQIVALAERHALPAVYPLREFCRVRSAEGRHQQVCGAV
jgi:putative ABC transport system substrate-binding protein